MRRRSRRRLARHYRFAVDELDTSLGSEWTPSRAGLSRGGSSPLPASGSTRHSPRRAEARGAVTAPHAVFAGRESSRSTLRRRRPPGRRWSEAAGELDWLELILSDGRDFLCGDVYGRRTLVWTVFPARIPRHPRTPEIGGARRCAPYRTPVCAPPDFRDADVWPPSTRSSSVRRSARDGGRVRRARCRRPQLCRPPPRQVRLTAPSRRRPHPARARYRGISSPLRASLGRADARGRL